MVEIRYCVRWNYYPHAARLAAKIKEELGLDSTLIMGKTGEFSIRYKGIKIAEKGDPDIGQGFPSQKDVIIRIQEHLEE